LIRLLAEIEKIRQNKIKQLELYEWSRQLIENVKEYGEKMEIDLETMSDAEKKGLLMGMGVNVVGNVEGINIKISLRHRLGYGIEIINSLR